MSPPCFVGIDVSKDHLDVHLLPQAQAFRLMKRVLPPDSELSAPAMRKKTGVVFGVNVPKDLQSDLLDAAWSAVVLATVSAAVNRQTNTRKSMASPLSSAAGTGRVRPGATTPGYKRLAQA